MHSTYIYYISRYIKQHFCIITATDNYRYKVRYKIPLFPLNLNILGYVMLLYLKYSSASYNIAFVPLKYVTTP